MARTPEQNNAIITGNIPRQLLLFFFPIWLGTMFQQLYNTVDTLIVGNFVGTQALAAVGATSSFVQLLVGLFVGLCSGAGVIIAQSFGAGDHDEVNRQVHTALALAIAGGAALTVIGLLISRPVLRLMQTAADCEALAFVPHGRHGRGVWIDGGPPAERLRRHLAAVTQGATEARQELARIAAWQTRALAATARIKGENPARVIAELAAHPLLSAAMIEARAGISRDTAERLLARLRDLGLAREVTGGRRFRLWAAAG